MISTVFRVNIEKDKAELVKAPPARGQLGPGRHFRRHGGHKGSKSAAPRREAERRNDHHWRLDHGWIHHRRVHHGRLDDGRRVRKRAAGGGAGGDMPAEDATFVPPPGWIDFEDLDFVPDERKVGPAVAGATGQDPSGDGDDDSRPGPQGGDWAVNPGSENMMTDVDRNTDLRDVSAVTWVGQPSGGDEDLPEEMPADSRRLQPEWTLRWSTPTGATATAQLQKPRRAPPTGRRRDRLRLPTPGLTSPPPMGRQMPRPSNRLARPLTIRPTSAPACPRSMQTPARPTTSFTVAGAISAISTARARGTATRPAISTSS